MITSASVLEFRIVIRNYFLQYLNTREKRTSDGRMEHVLTCKEMSGLEKNKKANDCSLCRH